MTEGIFKEDLAQFLNSNELGDIATWNGNTFDVQFFNEFDPVDLGILNLEIEGAAPAIIARDEDIEGIQHGARVVIGELSGIGDVSFQDSADVMFVNTQDVEFDKSGQMEYEVIEIKPDGTGMTVLILSKD